VIVQDVLVSVDTAAGPGDGSFVRYRVQLLSVASREVARAEHSELAEELGEPIELIQEPETARFALRVGSFATRTGAIAYQHELLGRGFESARVVEEVSRGSGARFSPPQPGGLVLRARATDELLFPGGTLRAIPGAKGDWLEVDGRPYRGYLEVSLNDVGGLRVVNVVGFEDYLRGVVPAELSPNAFPEKEALKAQAIAARTYAVKRRGQFSAEGYDLCATPACQVYRGVGVEHDLSDEAVRETTGEILTFRGQPIDAL
jgi:stage II sporulation protein D